MALDADRLRDLIDEKFAELSDGYGDSANRENVKETLLAAVALAVTEEVNTYGGGAGAGTIFSPEVGVLELVLGVLKIAAGGVTDAKLRNSAGASVMGRASGSSGTPADIVAGADGLPLRRNGGVLAFGTLPPDAIDGLTISLATLSSLSGTVSSLSGTVSSLSITVSGLSSDVSGLTSDVAALTGTVGTLSSDVSDLTSDLATLTGTVGTLSSDVGALAATVAGRILGTSTVNLAGAWDGSFTITDAALTAGMRVLVQWQPTDDEAELDSIFCTARAATAGAVIVSWRATGPRHGNHTFAYSGG